MYRLIPYEAALSIGVETPLLGRLKIPVRHSGDLKVPTLQDAESWKNIFNAIDRIRSL